MGGICTVQVYQKSNNVKENGSQYVGDIMVQKVSSKHLSIIDLLTQMLSDIPFLTVNRYRVVGELSLCGELSQCFPDRSR